MRCDGNAGISFQTNQGNRHSSRDEEGKTGLFLSCGRTLGVPLEWRQVCLGTCLDATMVSRTLSRLKRESGISLQTPQWKRASSRIEGRISWFSRVAAANVGFLSGYDRNLRDPFGRPQESPFSMRVARALLGFLCSRCR